MLSPLDSTKGFLVTAAIRDITTRKNMERLKNEFVSTVSHKLRTSLCRQRTTCTVETSITTKVRKPDTRSSRDRGYRLFRTVRGPGVRRTNQSHARQVSDLHRPASREPARSVGAAAVARDEGDKMTALRILLIDDDADIREVATLSLCLDPQLSVRGCASGEEGLAAAIEYVPDLILLDVMMPYMDGPTTLAGLRGNPRTATIPVIFMTARAQSREIEQFKSLGAAGVIAKPFDPMTLVALVRSLVYPVVDSLAESRTLFLARINKNADALFRCRSALSNEVFPLSVLAQIRDVAHGLAGAAGVFGFARIGDAAADLDEVTTAELGGGNDRKSVARSLDRLLSCMRTDLPKLGREATPEVLDRVLFEDLRANFGSDRIRILLAKFEAQVDASVIGVADRALDRVQLLQQAHRLIGTAGALGFHALSEVSRELEDACCEVEDRFAVLTDALKRAAEIKTSTKRELSLVLAQIGRAA
jgi:CheY-like chemotaxis protein